MFGFAGRNILKIHILLYYRKKIAWHKAQKRAPCGEERRGAAFRELAYETSLVVYFQILLNLAKPSEHRPM